METGDVIAVFTNRGARLKSWRLKHYLDDEKQPQELVERSRADAAAAVYAADADDAAERDAERRAVRRERRAAGRRRASQAGPICDSSIATAPAFTPSKSFTWTLVLHRHVPRDRDRRRSGAARRRCMGTRCRRSICRPAASFKGRRACCFEDGAERRPADGRRHRRASRRTKATSGYAGVDDNYFMIAALDTGPGQGHFSAGDDSARRRTDAAAARALLSFTIEPPDEQ